MCKFFGFYGFAKSHLYEMAFSIYFVNTIFNMKMVSLPYSNKSQEISWTFLSYKITVITYGSLPLPLERKCILNAF